VNRPRDTTTTVARELRAARAPDEAASEQRAWEVVRSAYAARPAPTRRRPTLRPRFAIVPAVALIVGVLALTPAGATVHRWIEQTLGVRHARTALFSLPAPGRILVSGAGGVWTVASDGSRRRLGSWSQATWSAHGLYVAVAGRTELQAVDGRGVVRWSVARPSVRFPRWFAPDGYRVAYLSGRSLRVIAGDGTGDHLLAPRVASVPPAWQPGHRYVLAYADARSGVVVRNADTGQVEWSRTVRDGVRLLQWSADGTRLLALNRRRATVYDAAGRVLVTVPATFAALDAALSPDGRTLALLDGGDVELVPVGGGAVGGGAVGGGPGAARARPLFSGRDLRQLAWSPDGHWLLVSWPAANQWIFLRATGRPRLIAVSRIAQQFSSGGSRRPAFPSLDGWCCTAAGAA
jgi:hypothetical protein